MIRKVIIPVLLFTTLLMLAPNSGNTDDHKPVITQNTSEALKAPGLELLSLLRNRNFEALGRRLNSLQAAYESDTTREDDLANAFNWLAVPDPELENLFLGWQQSHPESYAANLALGSYYRALANQWRGSKFAAETHVYRFKMMDDYLSKAVTYLEKSLRLTGKPTFSYTRLISLAILQSDRASADRWLAEALKDDPYCVRPRTAYMRMLEPQWGGSFQAMKAFADEARKVKHPKLEKAARLYDGYISWYEGYQKGRSENYVGALNDFQKSISYEDSSRVRLDRARLYKFVGQTDLALAEIDRSLELNPPAPEAYYLRGETLLDMGRTDEALRELRFAAEFGDLNALSRLAALSFFGDLGVPINRQEGVRLWEKPAHFWDEYAAYNLGAAYERGLGVREDKVEAVRYYRIAADQGYEKAMNDLGMMLWYGRGTNINKSEAVKLWIEGARKGLWQSKHNLQFFLSPGERLKLAFTYPALLLEDKTLLTLAASGAIGFIVILAVVVRMVLALRKQDDRQGVSSNQETQQRRGRQIMAPNEERPGGAEGRERFDQPRITVKRLASKMTFFYKRIFPLIWFGFLGIFICIGLVSNAAGKEPGVMFLAGPIGMAIVGYFMMKKLVWDLIDEVYDEGTGLLFRNGNQEVRVSFKDVKNVSYSTMTNPPRVTLSIRYKTAFGDELTFLPQASWIPFKKNEDIERLIDRIDEAGR